MECVSRVAGPFIAAMVSIAYLGAALGDCERPILRASVFAVPTHHAALDSAHGSHAMPTGESRHSSMAETPAAPHAHGASAAHSEAAPAHPHAAQPEVAEASTPKFERGARRTQSRLQAKCLCGCSETRATIGGGASRLGATIPAVFLAKLPVAESVHGTFRVPGHVSGPVIGIDPIPI